MGECWQASVNLDDEATTGDETQRIRDGEPCAAVCSKGVLLAVSVAAGSCFHDPVPALGPAAVVAVAVERPIGS